MIVTGTFRLPPENVERFAPYMAAMVEASRAEPGCHIYRYVPDPDEPGLFHVVELWASRKALASHRSAHLREWRASWEAFGVGDVHLRTYSFAHPLRSIVAISKDRDADSTLVAYRRGMRPERFVALCLDHRAERIYVTRAAVRDAIQHPQEWCESCRQTALPGAQMAGIVTGIFDAGSVHDEP